MGQTSSNVLKKVAKPWAWWSGNPDSISEDNSLVLSKAATPFVFKRWGSQFFDEDGDLAHEFYEEYFAKSRRGRKRKWRRVTENLTPQGEIDLDFPRLHTDLPVVICEISR